MLVLIDGYNATMRTDGLLHRSKHEQREALIARASAWAPVEHGARAEVVIVFDARDSLLVSSERRGRLLVVYAADADDEIVRRCEAARGPVVVYTNDLRLRARISQDVGRRVHYRDTAVLFDQGGRGQRGLRRTERPREPLNGELPADADRITEELSREWLGGEE